MVGRLSVALLLAATAAAAAEQASDVKIDENGQAYKIKKICRTSEVAGSFIPRTSCVTKKILVKKPEAATQEAIRGGGNSPENAPAPAPEER